MAGKGTKMATFTYTARSARGQQVAGTIQADNEAAVARSLSEQQLFPIDVREQSASAGASTSGGHIKLRDLALFYQQLADLLRASVPLLRALDTLEKSVSSKRLAQVIGQVRNDVGEGQTLADALAARGETFSPLHVAMVRAGETAGFLEDVCQNLGEFLDRQDDLRNKVRGAMIYPALLTVIGLGVILVTLLWLVPMFKPAFAEMPLPWPTRLLFAVSGVLGRYHWIVAVVLGGALAGIVGYIRSDAGRAQWDRLKLHVPIAGSVLSAVCITRFCRILGTMLRNGVPMMKSLQISKAAAGNVQLERAAGRAVEAVEAGEPLVQPLRESEMFPAQVIEMIAIAEESNNLENALLQIAETTERRTNRQVDQAVRLVEPLILVLIASIVAFVAVGLLYPIFTMSRTLGG
jgi:general secretion pathway protein F/type IV pilus assembly protein PilC